MFNLLFYSFIFLIILELIIIWKLKKYIKKMHNIKNKIYFVAETAVKEDDINKIYELALKVAIESIPKASKGSILMLNDKNQFYYASLVGYSPNVKNLTLKKEEIYLYKLNNFKETTLIKNPCKFDEDNLSIDTVDKLKKLNALNLSCLICSPIYIDNNIIGVMNIDCEKKDYIFKRDDIILIDYIKNQLQLVIKGIITKEKLMYLVNYDELTGTYNKRCFHKVIKGNVEKLRKDKNQALVIIDIDKFKNINDLYGHIIGDKILKNFCNIIKENLDGEYTLFRIGGDEFAILFYDISKKGVINKMEKIRSYLNDTKIYNIVVNFSYGICFFSECQGMNWEEIVSLADENMYKNKRKNKLKILTF
ncbi:GGDEF domain-containing protein [Clostridium niameyense]|nr:GGDEF domain-containing protein [Clostridium niameyense]